MKKHISVSITAIILAGCTTVAPVQMYRPAKSDGAPWQINGKYNAFNDNISIFIDGKEAVKGSFPILQYNVDLTGKYRDMSVTASCSRGPSPAYPTRCIVFVGNERAVTLQF